MPSNVPCRFYQRGICNRGDDCTFYHEPQAEHPKPEACKFFQRGFCAAGNSCRFSHEQSASHQEDDWPPDLVNSHPDEDLYEAYGLVFEGDALNPSYLPPEMKAAAIAAKGVMVEDKWDEDQTPAVEEEDPFEKETWELWAVAQRPGLDMADRSLCPHFLTTGRCPEWRSCPHPHGDYCEGCRKWCLHPYNRPRRTEHAAQCSDRADRLESRQVSSEQECAICLEVVMEKKSSERRFGLMACEHPFCLACVRGWRSKADNEADLDTAVRSCPVCRQTTHFVTPSKVWPRSAEEKAAIVTQYKERLGMIDCKYWSRSVEGEKSCPFGNSCFYRHLGAEKMQGPRKFMTADGEVRFGNPVQLSEFLSEMHL